jgi:hypothetical protein
LVTVLLQLHWILTTITLGICRHPPCWPTARTHRWPTFVRVAELRYYTSPAYIHTRCRVCPHSRWPTARTHRWLSFVRVAEPCCYPSLAYIHSHCRVCPHPSWPTARTHRSLSFIRIAEPCIASLHHTRCRVRLHPPRWPIAATHPWISFVRVAELPYSTSLSYIGRCCRILLVLRSHAHARDCIPSVANLLSSKVSQHSLRLVTALLQLHWTLTTITLGVFPYPPRWPTARTHRWLSFVRVAEPRCYASLVFIHPRHRFLWILHSRTHARDCIPPVSILLSSQVTRYLLGR